jgi:glycerol uptake facilitator-like aquaporin
MLTDTFTGIQPENVLLFIISQLIGAFLAYLVNKLIEAD